MSDDDIKLLSVDQVAKRLGVHRKTVLNWIHSGDLVALTLGKGYKVTEDDLREFLKHRRTDQKQQDDNN